MHCVRLRQARQLCIALTRTTAVRAHPSTPRRLPPPFQKIHEWLRELKDSGVLDAVSATTTSVMRAAVGPRLVSFLVDLTHVALVVEHERLAPGAGVSAMRLGAALESVGAGRPGGHTVGPAARRPATCMPAQRRACQRSTAWQLL